MSRMRPTKCEVLVWHAFNPLRPRRRCPRLPDCELQLSNDRSAEELTADLTRKNLRQQGRNSVTQLPLHVSIRASKDDILRECLQPCHLSGAQTTIEPVERT